MKLTRQQLRLMIPNATDFNIGRYLEPINTTLERFEINTPLRIAAFIAQVTHESGSLKYNEEIASGLAYEGRLDLGNKVKGDGKKFKGRGLIQLTGRANYTAFSKFCGRDLVSGPSLVANPDLSALAAGWFWDSRKLNTLADSGDFKSITKRINGGYNGLADRIKHYTRCKSVLNVT